MFIGNIYYKQNGLRPDCPLWKHLIKVHVVFIRDNFSSEVHLNNCSRRKTQSLHHFQDKTSDGIRVNLTVSSDPEGVQGVLPGSPVFK